MDNLFRCEYCKEIYENKDECHECELSHGKVVPCTMHMSDKKDVDCTWSILDRMADYLFTFRWEVDTSGKTSTKTISVEKEKVNIEVKGNE